MKTRRSLSCRFAMHQMPEGTYSPSCAPRCRPGPEGKRRDLVVDREISKPAEAFVIARYALKIDGVDEEIFHFTDGTRFRV